MGTHEQKGCFTKSCMILHSMLRLIYKCIFSSLTTYDLCSNETFFHCEFNICEFMSYFTGQIRNGHCVLCGDGVFAACPRCLSFLCHRHLVDDNLDCNAHINGKSVNAFKIKINKRRCIWSYLMVTSKHALKMCPRHEDVSKTSESNRQKKLKCHYKVGRAPQHECH